MSDSLIGIKGDGFVLLAADTAQARSVLVLKTNEDKIMELEKKKMVGGSGPQGDRMQFLEYIKRNLALYRHRTGLDMSVNAAAHYIRGEIAQALRRNPYQVNMLLAGHDDREGSNMFFIDYLGSMHKLNYGCQGYAGHFLLGLLDRTWKENLTEAEAIEILKLCIKQLQERFVLNSINFVVKIVDKNGIRLVSLN